jgi:hypothetical protein
MQLAVRVLRKLGIVDEVVAAVTRVGEAGATGVTARPAPRFEKVSNPGAFPYPPGVSGPARHMGGCRCVRGSRGGTGSGRRRFVTLGPSAAGVDWDLVAVGRLLRRSWFPLASSISTYHPSSLLHRACDGGIIVPLGEASHPPNGLFFWISYRISTARTVVPEGG